MEEQIVNLETAKLAKEKGFDCNTGKSYMSNGIIFEHEIVKHDKHFPFAPTQSLLQKWLREVHKIDAQAYATASGYAAVIEKSYFTDDVSGGTLISNLNHRGPSDSGQWETYEKALEYGLQEALKLVK